MKYSNIVRCFVQASLCLPFKAQIPILALLAAINLSNYFLPINGIVPDYQKD